MKFFFHLVKEFVCFASQVLSFFSSKTKLNISNIFRLYLLNITVKVS